MSVEKEQNKKGGKGQKKKGWKETRDDKVWTGQKGENGNVSDEWRWKRLRALWLFTSLIITMHCNLYIDMSKATCMALRKIWTWRHLCRIIFSKIVEFSQASTIVLTSVHTLALGLPTGNIWWHTGSSWQLVWSMPKCIGMYKYPLGETDRPTSAALLLLLQRLVHHWSTVSLARPATPRPSRYTQHTGPGLSSTIGYVYILHILCFMGCDCCCCCWHSCLSHQFCWQTECSDLHPIPLLCTLSDPSIFDKKVNRI